MGRYRKDYWENQKERVAKQAKYHKDNRAAILKRQKQYRQQKRSLINNVALHYGCQNVNCCWSGNYTVAMLEFHHFNPKDKQFQIGRGADYGWKTLSKEINKCVVLCGNCHALFHSDGIEIDETMLCEVTERLEIIT